MERNRGLLKKLDRYIGIPLLFLIGVLRKKRNLPAQVNSIGIFAFAAIGDSILSSSLLPTLKKKFPNVKIIIFCSKANAAIYPLIDGFDQLVILPVTNPIRALRLLRQYSLDIVIDTSQWFRLGAFYAWLAKAKWSVGFLTRGQYRHYVYDETILHSNEVHEQENFQNLMIPLGCEASKIFALKKNLKHSDVLKFVLATDSYIVFHPWASGTKSDMREWPEKNWIDLADALANKGYKVLISGANADRSRASILVNQMQANDIVEVIAGKVDLKELANILLHAQACISINTGIAHLSAVLGVPTISLNGPTNSERWGVRGKKAYNLDVKKEEGGAFLNLGFEYPLNQPYVMNKISVSSVINALKTFE